MTEHIRVPVRVIGGERWGALSFYGPRHDFIGEKVKELRLKYTFAGNHRVRLFSFTKNVHWRLPAGVDLDISGVQPASRPPRRRGR